MSNLPMKYDFSQKAIKNALVQRANHHWSLKYSVSFIGGTLLFGTLFGFTYPIFLVILSTFGFSAISWVYNMFISAGNFEKSYVKNLQDKIREQTKVKQLTLKVNLLQYDCLNGAEQLVQFQTKFDILVDIIKSKFDETQLTYNRYYGIVQEVFLSGIDNLSDVVVAYVTLTSIDVSYIKKRLKKLKNDKTDNLIVKKELTALQNSLKSFEHQQQKIKSLLSENAVALGQLDETVVAISEISRIKDKDSQVDMEDSMRQLQQLTKRTKLY